MQLAPWVSARFGITAFEKGEAEALEGPALDSKSLSCSAYVTIPSSPQGVAATGILLCKLSPGEAEQQQLRVWLFSGLVVQMQAVPAL